MWILINNFSLDPTYLIPSGSQMADSRNSTKYLTANLPYNLSYENGVYTHKRINDLGRVVSRILSAPVARRRGSFIYCDLTRSPNRFRSRDGPSQGPLFGLAPNGVYRAASLTLGAVGSYPTFSPLPQASLRRFILCGTFRQSSSRINCPRVSLAEPRLRGIATFGVRTFLSR